MNSFFDNELKGSKSLLLIHGNFGYPKLSLCRFSVNQQTKNFSKMILELFAEGNSELLSENITITHYVLEYNVYDAIILLIV